MILGYFQFSFLLLIFLSTNVFASGMLSSPVEKSNCKTLLTRLSNSDEVSKLATSNEEYDSINQTLTDCMGFTHDTALVEQIKKSSENIYQMAQTNVNFKTQKMALLASTLYLTQSNPNFNNIDVQSNVQALEHVTALMQSLSKSTDNNDKIPIYLENGIKQLLEDNRTRVRDVLHSEVDRYIDESFTSEQFISSDEWEGFLEYATQGLKREAKEDRRGKLNELADEILSEIILQIKQSKAPKTLNHYIRKIMNQKASNNKYRDIADFVDTRDQGLRKYLLSTFLNVAKPIQMSLNKSIPEYKLHVLKKISGLEDSKPEMVRMYKLLRSIHSVIPIEGTGLSIAKDVSTEPLKDMSSKTLINKLASRDQGPAFSREIESFHQKQRIPKLSGYFNKLGKIIDRDSTLKTFCESKLKTLRKSKFDDEYKKELSAQIEKFCISTAANEIILTEEFCKDKIIELSSKSSSKKELSREKNNNLLSNICDLENQEKNIDRVCLQLTDQNERNICDELVSKKIIPYNFSNNLVRARGGDTQYKLAFNSIVGSFNEDSTSVTKENITGEPGSGKSFFIKPLLAINTLFFDHKSPLHEYPQFISGEIPTLKKVSSYLGTPFYDLSIDPNDKDFYRQVDQLKGGLLTGKRLPIIHTHHSNNSLVQTILGPASEKTRKIIDEHQILPSFAPLTTGKEFTDKEQGLLADFFEDYYIKFLDKPENELEQYGLRSIRYTDTKPQVKSAIIGDIKTFCNKTINDITNNFVNDILGQYKKSFFLRKPGYEKDIISYKTAYAFSSISHDSRKGFFPEQYKMIQEIEKKQKNKRKLSRDEKKLIDDYNNKFNYVKNLLSDYIQGNKERSDLDFSPEKYKQRLENSKRNVTPDRSELAKQQEFFTKLDAFKQFINLYPHLVQKTPLTSDFVIDKRPETRGLPLQSLDQKHFSDPSFSYLLCRKKYAIYNKEEEQDDCEDFDFKTFEKIPIPNACQAINDQVEENDDYKMGATLSPYNEAITKSIFTKGHTSIVPFRTRSLLLNEISPNKNTFVIDAGNLLERKNPNFDVGTFQEEMESKGLIVGRYKRDPVSNEFVPYHPKNKDGKGKYDKSFYLTTKRRVGASFGEMDINEEFPTNIILTISPTERLDILSQSLGRVINRIGFRIGELEAKSILKGTSLPSDSSDKAQKKLSFVKNCLKKKELESYSKELLKNSYINISTLKDWNVSNEDDKQSYLQYLSLLTLRCAIIEKKINLKIVSNGIPSNINQLSPEDIFKIFRKNEETSRVLSRTEPKIKVPEIAKDRKTDDESINNKYLSYFKEQSKKTTKPTEETDQYFSSIESSFDPDPDDFSDFDSSTITTQYSEDTSTETDLITNPPQMSSSVDSDQILELNGELSEIERLKARIKELEAEVTKEKKEKARGQILFHLSADLLKRRKKDIKDTEEKYNNAIEALEEKEQKLQSLQNELEKAQNSTLKDQEKINSLEEQIKQEKLSYEQQMSRMKNDIEDRERKLQSITDEFEEKISELTTKLSNVKDPNSTEAKELEAEYNKVMEKYELNKMHLSEVESKLAEIEASNHALQKELGDKNTLISRLQEQNKKLSDEKEATLQQVELLGRDLDLLNIKIGDQYSRPQEDDNKKVLKKRLSLKDDLVEGLNDKLNKLKTILKTFEDNQELTPKSSRKIRNEQESEIESLKKYIADLQQKIDQQDVEYAQLKTQFKEVSKNLKTKESLLTQLEDEKENLGEEYKTLLEEKEEKIKSLSQTLDEKEQELSSVENNFTDDEKRKLRLNAQIMLNNPDYTDEKIEERRRERKQQNKLLDDDYLAKVQEISKLKGQIANLKKDLTSKISDKEETLERKNQSLTKEIADLKESIRL